MFHFWVEKLCEVSNASCSNRYCKPLANLPVDFQAHCVLVLPADCCCCARGDADEYVLYLWLLHSCVHSSPSSGVAATPSSSAFVSTVVAPSALASSFGNKLSCRPMYA